MVPSLGHMEDIDQKLGLGEGSMPSTTTPSPILRAPSLFYFFWQG